MIHIKKFIDKVSMVESKQGKDLVIPMTEARGLRDEVSKLLSDLHNFNDNKQEEIVDVQIKGGKFK